jgi:hypothetical protein
MREGSHLKHPNKSPPQPENFTQSNEVLRTRISMRLVCATEFLHSFNSHDFPFCKAAEGDQALTASIAISVKEP